MLPITFHFSLLAGLLGCQNDNEAPNNQELVVEQDTSDTDTATVEETDSEGCINDADYFEQKVWGEALSPVCYSCHNTESLGTVTWCFNQTYCQDIRH